MEVHPPHNPIHSVKEFMLHLLAITIGLLIALGLERSVEWFHYRHLVHEAKENISREILDNQHLLSIELGALPAEEKQLETILGVVDDRQHGRNPKHIPDYGWTHTVLEQSAWSTSMSTGATAHMGYDEVKRYSELYELQQMFNTASERYLSARGDMYAFLTRFDFQDKPADAEFENAKRAITSEIIIGKFMAEIGRDLDGAYVKVNEAGK